MAMKDLLLPGALIGAGALIIYQFTRQRHAEGKLALAESGGRELPPAEGAQPQAAAPTQVPTSGATGAGAGGPGLQGVPRITPRQQARLLMLYRADNITARQYLNAGGNYAALRVAEAEMGDGYMPLQPMYGPPTV